MKRNKFAGHLMLAAGILAAASCSDFSDYNSTPVDQDPLGNVKLWENIQSEPRLSDFAALVKKVGYDTLFSATRNYTVWAPVNGTFDKAAFDAMSVDELRQKFIGNHVAEYVHGASGDVNERIHTINGKSFEFEYSGGRYTFGGNEVSTANIASRNGVIHLLNGNVLYRPSLYEYVMSLGKEDSICSHLTNYELSFIDTERSVEGPMVNGLPTYIDSVMITYNSYLNGMRAQIENEDSSYTMILPTSKAFKDAYDKIKPFYNIVPEFTVADPALYSSGSSTNSKTWKAADNEIDVEYLKDSLIRRDIIRDLIYSNNDTYNKWLVNEGENNDTVRSTRNTKYSDDKAFVETYVSGTETLSNGFARVVDSIALKPWEWYNPQLTVNPANSLANSFTAIFHTDTYNDPKHRVYGPDQKENSFKYAWFEPSGKYNKPDFFISLNNVMSATYNVYVVFLPWYVGLPSDSAKAAEFLKPNLLNFSISYSASNGNLATYNFSSKYLNPETDKAADKNPRTQNKTTAFVNDPTKTDTVFIGQMQFPVCYKNVSSVYTPVMRVHSPIGVFSKADTDAYTRDVRIGKIILRPVEYDEKEPLIK